MDIKNKRLVKGGCGNQATEYPSTHWFVRAGSWQYGAEVTPEAIEAEKREQDLLWGTPHADNVPDPGMGNPSGDAPLPNPHNFSSNPGFMGTGDMATAGMARSGGNATISTAGAGRSLRRGSSGGTGTVGFTAVASKGNASLPAPGDVNPGQEGGPQVVSSGYSG